MESSPPKPAPLHLPPPHRQELQLSTEAPLASAEQVSLAVTELPQAPNKFFSRLRELVPASTLWPRSPQGNPLASPALQQRKAKEPPRVNNVQTTKCYPCKECDNVFSDGSSLFNHIAKGHNKNVNDGDRILLSASG